MWKGMRPGFLLPALVAAVVVIVATVGGAIAADPRVSVNLAQCCPPTQAYGAYAHGYTKAVARRRAARSWSRTSTAASWAPRRTWPKR